MPRTRFVRRRRQQQREDPRRQGRSSAGGRAGSGAGFGHQARFGQVRWRRQRSSASLFLGVGGVGLPSQWRRRQRSSSGSIGVPTSIRCAGPQPAWPTTPPTALESGGEPSGTARLDRCFLLEPLAARGIAVGRGPVGWTPRLRRRPLTPRWGPDGTARPRHSRGSVGVENLHPAKRLVLHIDKRWHRYPSPVGLHDQTGPQSNQHLLRCARGATCM